MHKQNVRFNSADYDAVIFDLDGVVTQTAGLHARCWKQTFDEFLRNRRHKTGESLHLFDIKKIIKNMWTANYVMTAFGVFCNPVISICLMVIPMTLGIKKLSADWVTEKIYYMRHGWCFNYKQQKQESLCRRKIARSA